MSTLTFNKKTYLLAPEESVLSCLLRQGIPYPNSCQAGVCQSCLIKASDGEINPSWQEGLPDTLKAQGYFLSCLAKPTNNLTLSAPEASECEVSATILDLAPLNYNVLQLKIQVDHFENWLPGQYLNLINAKDTARSYSIANIPAQDKYIELHIKLIANGRMSQWLQDSPKIGSTVRIRGPFGKCYYTNPNHLSYEMLLVGTGTGLAPLVGIMKDALLQGHCGKITLLHGGLIDDDIYYRKEIKALAALFESVQYEPCVLKSQGLFPELSVEQLMLRHIHCPSTLRVYVCGPKETTNKLKTSAFLAGVPSRFILSDAFL